jgi:hypothetical protein
MGRDKKLDIIRYGSVIIIPFLQPFLSFSGEGIKISYFIFFINSNFLKKISLKLSLHQHLTDNILHSFYFEGFEA